MTSPRRCPLVLCGAGSRAPGITRSSWYAGNRGVATQRAPPAGADPVAAPPTRPPPPPPPPHAPPRPPPPPRRPRELRPPRHPIHGPRPRVPRLPLLLLLLVPLLLPSLQPRLLLLAIRRQVTRQRLSLGHGRHHRPHGDRPRLTRSRHRRPR